MLRFAPATNTPYRQIPAGRNPLTGGHPLLLPWTTGERLRIPNLLALVLLLIMAMGGCASQRVSLPLAAEGGKDVASSCPAGWWYARFVMDWPEGREPSWYLDALLAHQVIRPALDRFGSDVALWRVHRRAARDQAGHQLSFIFYSSPETARQIFSALQANPLLGELKKRRVVTRESYDDTGTVTRPNIEDTSDRYWPPAIQKSWPYYIQGVSEMWLSLIVELAGRPSSGTPPTDVDELLRFYEQLNGDVNRLWREEGQHAFLHHLNALFGYQALMVREKRLMDF